MTRNTYDIIIKGNAGGGLVACGRYRLKGHDKDRAITKAVRLFRRAFRDHRTDKIIVNVGRI